MPVYILHLHEPISGRSHYIGYTDNLTRRLQEHRRGVLGKTSRVMIVATMNGVSWEHVNTLETGNLKYDYQLEQELHTKPDSHIARMYCPICMRKR